MMKYNAFFLMMFIVFSLQSIAAEKDEKKEESSNTRQYYSGMVGFYQPSDGLNNGLLIGVDGITEFIHYNFFLSAALDLYPKQTFDFFASPKPDVQQQQILLLPLHVNFGYKIFEVEDADLRGYIGAGGGYYFYFYSVDYRTSSGGVIPSFSNQSETKNGGNVFGTLFARLLINKIFVEPRLYLASTVEETIGGYHYTVNPSGFAITLGFQYH